MQAVLSKNKLKDRTGKNGNGKKKCGEAQTFDFVDVVAEKNKKTGSCTDGKSGECRAERNGSFSEKLGDDYGRSAVGNKTHKTGNKGLEKAFACNELRKSFFADGFDAKFKAEHHNKDESESFCGVGKGAFKKSVVAFGVAMGMFFLNFFNFFLGDFEKSEAVHHKTGDDCKDKFRADERNDFSSAFGVGDKNGNGLVACGNENRKHSSGGDYAVGIKVCRNNGKTALGNNAEKCADGCSGFSEFCKPGGKFFRVAVLDKFDEKIRSEKERKRRSGVFKGVGKNV